MNSSDGSRLRLARLARGLSQAEVAEGAQVSRQAVAGVEAGRWDPSLKVALSLARVLGVAVEELFGPEGPYPAVKVTPLEDPGRTTSARRVVLAQVGTQTVAVPLWADASMRAGFVPASATLNQPPKTALPFAQQRPTLVIAGCDPAFSLLEEPLSRLDPPIGLAWWPCGSETALRLAQQGLVHVAGAHLKDAKGDGYNGQAARRHLSDIGAEVLHFARWSEGFAVGPKIGGSPADLASLVERGAKLVNREVGSEARAVLERERARLSLDPDEILGYTTEARGHLQVACAIASGLGDVGIASEPAALAFGLKFWPVAEERYDLVLPRPLLGTAEVQGLLRVLASSQLRGQLNSLEGYGISGCGEAVDSF